MSPAFQSFTPTAADVAEAAPPAVDGAVAPHGGVLVDRFVPALEAAQLERRATGLPSAVLDAREQADLEMIATGAVSPLSGFLRPRDYAAVVERLRLDDGTVWPLPLTLALAPELAALVRPETELALRDERGRLRGVLRVDELFERDPLHEAQHVYGTTDPAHPGVAYLLSRPRILAGGPVVSLPLPADLPFAEHRLTPRALRAEIRGRGWRSVAGFQTRNPIHRAHEHLTKLALEVADGLVIHPLVGETKGDDVPAGVRFRAYEVLLERYYPRERTLLSVFPAAMRYAGPREALFHALVRKNYGIDRLIVGRDHAGVGKYYGPYDAQRIFDRFEPAELGVRPLKLEPTFFCRACEALASTRTCPHGAPERLELSGTRVREILSTGGELPHEFTRPEVAAVLREYYSGAPAGAQPGRPAAPAGTATTPAVATARDASAAAPLPSNEGTAATQATPAPAATGFVLWLTGLSGAGKSTLATALRDRLAPERRLELLDGDEVRTFLSKGLGFSKADRDTNIERIGYVARLLARAGVGVVTAAISPYAEARGAVRRLAEREGLAFLEVFVDAPLEVLVERDVKGLYRKALAGEIANFTGVSDPYEPPVSPELVVRSDRETPGESIERIVALLREHRLIEGAAA